MTPQDINRAVLELAVDMDNALAKACKKRKPFHPRASPWWDETCVVAVRMLHTALGAQAKKVASAHLRGATRAAKRKWADKVIGSSKLWEVATWRRGHRLSKVPPLKVDAGLEYHHKGKTEALRSRFFVPNPPDVPWRLPDDPPQLPPRLVPSFTPETIGTLLGKTSNTSAPGASGYTWRCLKWLWNCDKNCILNLVKACIEVGHHLMEWKSAIVCVIPKPGQADYSLPKNFRPISLLH